MQIQQLNKSHSLFKRVQSGAPDPPSQLFYRGQLPDADMPLLSVVGTRRPSEYGKQVTYKIVSGLATRGVGIISGLALGTDAIAHRAALDAGGYTLAVLASGLEKAYPATNAALARDILTKNGGLISEYEVNVDLHKHLLLARNRIVAYASDGLLVSEAAAKSGTSSTVEYALDSGRNVMAIPGNITSELSIGTNRMLQNGATLVMSVNDVLFGLGLKQTELNLPLGSNQAQSTILELIHKGSGSGHELRHKSNLSAVEFANTISQLEIAGQIRALGGDLWTLN